MSNESSCFYMNIVLTVIVLGVLVVLVKDGSGSVDSNQPHYEFPNVKKNVFVAFLKIKLLLRRHSHFIYTLLMRSFIDAILWKTYLGNFIKFRNIETLKYRISLSKIKVM